MTIAVLALIATLNILMLLLWRRLRQARQQARASTERTAAVEHDDTTAPLLFEADHATMALYLAERTRASRAGTIEPARRNRS